MRQRPGFVREALRKACKKRHDQQSWKIRYCGAPETQGSMMYDLQPWHAKREN
jgi:hypothetical protein